MFVVRVIVIVIQIFFYCLGGYLSVLMRNCKNLMPICFDGTCLMYTDMPRLCCNDSLIGFQKGIDHNGIRLRASYQKLHSSSFTFTGFSDSVSGGFRDLIKPISCCIYHISFHHLPQNIRMSSFCIITGEAEFFIHILCGLLIDLFYVRLYNHLIHE